MRADRALLEFDARRDADELGRELTDAGLVADEGDTRPFASCFSSSASSVAAEPPGASDSTLTIGGLGEDADATISAVCRVRTSGLVSTTSNDHAEPRKPARRLAQPRHAFVSQRTFRVVRPRLAAFFGDAVANQIELVEISHD